MTAPGVVQVNEPTRHTEKEYIDRSGFVASRVRNPDRGHPGTLAFWERLQSLAPGSPVVLQGLKPNQFCDRYGTSKLVPCYKGKLVPCYKSELAP